MARESKMGAVSKAITPRVCIQTGAPDSTGGENAQRIPVALAEGCLNYRGTYPALPLFIRRICRYSCNKKQERQRRDDPLRRTYMERTRLYYEAQGYTTLISGRTTTTPPSAS